MLFNSWVFAFYLPLVLAVYYLLPRRGQNAFLLAASYVFYGYWDWRFLSLLLVSTVVDYTVGLLLARTEAEPRRRLLLAASCVVNLTLLGFFKYFNFFLEGAADIARLLHLPLDTPTLNILLPMGISFYTFQTMSYTIDVFRREVPAERSLLDFALYITYFPQLVAGPIERARSLLPQFKAQRRISAEDLRIGLWLLLKGFFMKLVVADNLGIVVDDVFSGYGEYSGGTALAATYAFTFQVYGDFAGYSHIARGAARLMGIQLRLNFDLPFISRTPSEFWRRWHISLSSWLRDYLYVPLGGNRYGPGRMYLALFLTMTLSGLWHGAAWTFLIWGMLHGLWLIAHRVLRDLSGKKESDRPWVRALGLFLTFHFFALGLVLFRSHSLPQAWSLYASIFGGPYDVSRELVAVFSPVLLLGAMLWALDLWSGSRDDPRSVPGWRWIGPPAFALLLLALVVLSPTQTESFVYFQF